MLSAREVRVVRGRDSVVLDGASLDLPAGVTLGLRAPSGWGKTSLLRVLALLHPVAAGTVVLDGTTVVGTGYDVPVALRRRVALVHQSPRRAVDPRWSVRAVLAEPWRVVGRRPEEPELTGLLEEVGLTPQVLDRTAHRLSDGQLHRLALARALAVRPVYLLLDEPTAAVDALTASKVVALVRAHQEEHGTGVLIAAHDADLLASWCDHVLSPADLGAAVPASGGRAGH